MANPKAVIELLLQDAKFKRAISDAVKAGDQVKNKFENTKAPLVNLSGGFDRIKTSMAGALKLIGPLAAGFAGLAAGVAFKKGIDAAIEQENAVNAVATALKRAGDLSQESLQDMTSFAASLQDVTGIGDETTLKMLSLAQSFGANRDLAKEVVTAATELSAATGKSLNEAVNQVSKTLGGFAGELGEVNPAIKALTKEQLQAGEAARLLIEQYGGTAASKMQTFGGALEATKGRFGDLLEEIGNLIIKNPLFVDAIRGAGDILKSMTAWLAENGEAIRRLTTSRFVMILRGTESYVIPPLKFAVEVMGALFDATMLVSGSMLQLVSAMSQFRAVEVIIKGAMHWATNLAQTVVTSAGIANAALASLFELAGIEFPTGGIEFFAELSLKVEDLKSKIDGLDIPGALDDATLAIADFGLKGKQAFDDIGQGMTDLRPKIEGLARSIEESGSKVPGIIPVGGGAAGAAGSRSPGSSPSESSDAESDAEAAAKAKEERDKLSEQEKKIRDSAVWDLPEEAGWIGAASEVGRRLEEGGINAGKALLSSIGGGKEGSKQFVGAIGGAIADAIAPGSGQFVNQLLQTLGQDPEAFRAQIDAFIEGVPEIIDNIVENIPYLVEKLAENSGEIITALVAGVPRIIVALVQAIPVVAVALANEIAGGFQYQIGKLNQGLTQLQNSVHQAGVGFSDGMKGAADRLATYFKGKIPDIAKSIGRELTEVFKDVTKPFTDFASEIENLITDVENAAKPFQKVIDKITSAIEKIQEFIDSIIPGGSGGGAGFFGSIGKGDVGGALGELGKGRLATGGFVRGHGNKDTVPALLSPGELVIDRTTGPRLNRFMDQYADRGVTGSDRSNDEIVGLLTRLAQLMDRPQHAQVELTLDGRVLARQMFDLSKRNERLAS